MNLFNTSDLGVEAKICCRDQSKVRLVVNARWAAANNGLQASLTPHEVVDLSNQLRRYATLLAAGINPESHDG